MGYTISDFNSYISFKRKSGGFNQNTDFLKVCFFIQAETGICVKEVALLQCLEDTWGLGLGKQSLEKAANDLRRVDI